MNVRNAQKKDISGISTLLTQVCLVHHHGRPDLFRYGQRKYTNEELEVLLSDPSRPVFVAVDESDNVLGHAFCIHQEFKDHNVLTDIKTLYIDDICILEDYRGKKIGKLLYDHVHQYAKKHNYYNITLNVWSFNTQALSFYQQCGFETQKIGMEVIL